MNDPDVREKMWPAQPNPWDAGAQAGRADIRMPRTGFTSAEQWGLASLLVGCAVLVAGCVLLVFSVLLFRGGPAGIPTALAFAGGLIGTLAVLALSVASLLFGIRGWQQAYAVGSSPALGLAGVAASITGLVVWLIATIDVLMILTSFTR